MCEHFRSHEKKGRLPWQQWIEEELECFQGGDDRIHRRAKQILAGQYANPTRTFYASAGSSAAAKATYRFQKNPSRKYPFTRVFLLGEPGMTRVIWQDHPKKRCLSRMASDFEKTVPNAANPLGSLKTA